MCNSTKIDCSICCEEDGFDECIDSLSCLSGNVYEDCLATVLFCDQVVLGELLADLIWVCAFFINLVHCNNDRYISCLSVVERFDCLRHDAVICSNYEDCDISDLCTTCTHSGKRLVTWCIDKGDGTIDASMIMVNLISTNVLCNSACFALEDFSLSNRIEQTCLTVIDVTHDCDNRWTGYEL